MAFARRGAPRPGRLRRMGRPVLIAVLVLAVWWGRRVDQAGQRPDPGSGTSASSETLHGYQVLEGARLVDHRRNDGDSFFIDHRGVEHEMRLYFVDCPEKYIAKHNAKRLGHQARYFGRAEPDEMVEVGLAARDFTVGLLAAGRFDVYTNWEGVYGNERHYCFVVLADGSYLSERLVAEGLARIYTKGESTPDGRSSGQFKQRLARVERQAKQAGAGAWDSGRGVR